MKARVKRLAMSIAAVLAVCQCAIALAYSPDVPWQSHSWFIETLEALGAKNWSDEATQELLQPSDFALMGYRLFILGNAFAFGLDSRAEIIAYSAISFWATCLIVDASSKECKQISSDFTSILSSLIICLPLLTWNSTVPRGMELGQYLGSAICIYAIWMILNNEKYTGEASVFLNRPNTLAFLSVIMLSGGYSAGTLVGLLPCIILCSNGTGALRRRSSYILSMEVAIALGLVCHYLYGSLHSVRSLSEAQNTMVNASPFGFAKWSMAALGSSFFNANSIDANPGLGQSFAIMTGVALLAALVYIIASCRFTKSSISGTIIFGVYLLFQGAGISTGIYYARRLSEFQIMSPWYTFFFKIAVSGLLLIISTLTISNRKTITRATGLISSYAVIGAMVTSLAVMTNYLQMNRYPAERQFWKERQAYIYMSDLDSIHFGTHDSKSSLLALDPETDKRFTRMLRANKWGPFGTDSAIDHIASAAERIILGAANYRPSGGDEDGMMGKYAVFNSYSLIGKSKICFRIPDNLPANRFLIRTKTKTLLADVATGKEPTCINLGRDSHSHQTEDSDQVLVVSEKTTKPFNTKDERRLSAQVAIE